MHSSVTAHHMLLSHFIDSVTFWLPLESLEYCNIQISNDLILQNNK